MTYCTYAVQSLEQIAIVFGSNHKAKLAARTVFGLAHRHGDILREGWKNILDCMVQLYRARLLPDVLIQVCDCLAVAAVHSCTLQVLLLTCQVCTPISRLNVCFVDEHALCTPIRSKWYLYMAAWDTAND